MSEIYQRPILRPEGTVTSSNPSLQSDSPSWLTTIASLAVGAAFFSLWFWLLPGWLGFDVAVARDARWRWIGAVPSVFGFSVALRCVWDFGRTGRGTPAPFVPPSKLVVVGFYRYVRNPMYVGFFFGWMGLWIVFGHASRVALLILLLAMAAVALFVKIYEEPTLKKMFAADYEEYCRNVPRWIPRLRAWSR
ncbi:MAG TPA: isoprenylcysteine carboxylmethyltransferase family protein [Candidatus Acidoferrum sp.]|nr:isoprenylcysteine carboxylmethyltransferase family protein [Candidatus Acidoferrum sp.]